MGGDPGNGDQEKRGEKDDQQAMELSVLPHDGKA
jgi:hypothetical protein